MDASLPRRSFLKTGMAALSAGLSIGAITNPAQAAALIHQTATPGLFARYAARGRWIFAPHLVALDQAIVETILGNGGCRRLIVTLPPRHGKSELLCKYLPAWHLGTFPDKRVIVAGYGDQFASEWGQKARDVFREHGPAVFGRTVRTDSSAVDNWQVADAEGGMKTCGVGGALTGRGANVLIVDDPVKNAEEAASEVYRNKTWDWFNSTAYTRLEPLAAVIVIQTRWHEDDLAGRLIRESNEGGEHWNVINFPAIGDDGAALWPMRYPLDELKKIRNKIGEYWWSALYMQRPTPRTGGMFKIDRIEIIPAAPALLARTCRAWDIASTPNAGDYTAGTKLGVDRNGVYYIMDLQRGQWDTDTRDRMILQTAEVDGQSVVIRGPQDPGAAGKDFALFFARKLAAFTVKTEPVSGDKALRADPFSAQVNAGNVKMVAGPWNRALLDELCIAKGEKINTIRGCVPIEEVVPGDLVATRAGWRRVLKSKCTHGNAEICKIFTDDGRSLRTTPNHPIFQPDFGFKPAARLRAGDALLRFIEESDSACIPTQRKSISTDTLEISGREGTSNSITTFGSARRVRFHGDGTSTTRTRIPRTICFPTSNAFLPVSILPCTAKQCDRQESTRSSVSYAENCFGRNSRIEQSRARSDAGINFSVRAGMSRNMSTSARIAENPSRRSKHDPNSAVKNASVPAPGRPGCLNRSSASGAESHSSPSRQRCDFAADIAVSALVMLQEKRPVYNLEVDGCPEFFVNGILVHNCSFPLGAHDDIVDALSDGFAELSKRRKMVVY